MWSQFRENPMHTLIAIGLMVTGVWLQTNDYYFKWPPALMPLPNDNEVGAIFVATGIFIIFWVLDERHPARWNRIQLTVAAGLMTALAVYQFLHWIVLGLEMPWISNSVIAGLIIVLARRSDSLDH